MRHASCCVWRSAILAPDQRNKVEALHGMGDQDGFVPAHAVLILKTKTGRVAQGGSCDPAYKRRNVVAPPSPGRLGVAGGSITNRFRWPHPGVTIDAGTGDCEVGALK